MEVKRAGGIGYILGNSEASGNELSDDAHVLPATAVNHENALKIYEYIKSTKEPTAYILPAKTVLGTKPAPFMAAFSSRGPNTMSPDILKPDITAPGLNILAAWSEASSPTSLADDKRVAKYNIMSGTSMSCPHIGGVSALLKAMHPDWSSAAIRSALMTSAGQSNNEGNPITDASGNPADPFQFGSGHISPEKAADPGLVYDASYTDYLLFLCSSGVTNLTKLTASFECPENPPSPANLNYPSLAIPKLDGTVTVVRTVTNVGSNKNTVYNVSVKPPTGISVKISPSVLYFNGAGQKMNFTITVKTDSEFKGRIEKGEHLFGWYTWSDKIHNVRSPIAVSVA
ncbi:subtilisin-like protease sbt5.4 [Phtheirospermum japonicum]|uniref:Subtilisin-like protease sbt5.4 n=1 Tax=Phtheirospermum japonicum TaxID=374723 RepID=A0A830C279_9LAMI|nr:subtilisin-like protease sbt5.4 [Phtheirospermum japonicum]